MQEEELKVVQSDQRKKSLDHLLWHHESSERLLHQVVQFGQTIAEFDKRAAVVARLHLGGQQVTFFKDFPKILLRDLFP